MTTGNYYDLQQEDKEAWDKKLKSKTFDECSIIAQQLQYFMDKIRPSCLTEDDRTDAMLYMSIMQMLEEMANGKVVFINTKEFRAIEAQSIEYFKLHKITCEKNMEDKLDDL